MRLRTARIDFGTAGLQAKFDLTMDPVQIMHESGNVIFWSKEAKANKWEIPVTRRDSKVVNLSTFFSVPVARADGRTGLVFATDDEIVDMIIKRLIEHVKNERTEKFEMKTAAGNVGVPQWFKDRGYQFDPTSSAYQKLDHFLKTHPLVGHLDGTAEFMELSQVNGQTTAFLKNVKDVSFRDISGDINKATWLAPVMNENGKLTFAVARDAKALKGPTPGFVPVLDEKGEMVFVAKADPRAENKLLKAMVAKDGVEVYATQKAMCQAQAQNKYEWRHLKAAEGYPYEGADGQTVFKPESKKFDGLKASETFFFLEAPKYQPLINKAEMADTDKEFRTKNKLIRWNSATPDKKRSVEAEKKLASEWMSLSALNAKTPAGAADRAKVLQDACEILDIGDDGVLAGRVVKMFNDDFKTVAEGDDDFYTNTPLVVENPGLDGKQIAEFVSLEGPKGLSDPAVYEAVRAVAQSVKIINRDQKTVARIFLTPKMEKAEIGEVIGGPAEDDDMTNLNMFKLFGRAPLGKSLATGEQIQVGDLKIQPIERIEGNGALGQAFGIIVGEKGVDNVFAPFYYTPKRLDNGKLVRGLVALGRSGEEHRPTFYFNKTASGSYQILDRNGDPVDLAGVDLRVLRDHSMPGTAQIAVGFADKTGDTFKNLDIVPGLTVTGKYFIAQENDYTGRMIRAVAIDEDNHEFARIDVDTAGTYVVEFHLSDDVGELSRVTYQASKSGNAYEIIPVVSGVSGQQGAVIEATVEVNNMTVAEAAADLWSRSGDVFRRDQKSQDTFAARFAEQVQTVASSYGVQEAYFGELRLSRSRVHFMDDGTYYFYRIYGDPLASIVGFVSQGPTGDVVRNSQFIGQQSELAYLFSLEGNAGFYKTTGKVKSAEILQGLQLSPAEEARIRTETSLMDREWLVKIDHRLLLDETETNSMSLLKRYMGAQDPWARDYVKDDRGNKRFMKYPRGLKEGQPVTMSPSISLGEISVDPFLRRIVRETKFERVEGQKYIYKVTFELRHGVNVAEKEQIFISYDFSNSIICEDYVTAGWKLYSRGSIPMYINRVVDPNSIQGMIWGGGEFTYSHFDSRAYRDENGVEWMHCKEVIDSVIPLAVPRHALFRNGDLWAVWEGDFLHTDVYEDT
ncbi:MAG: hypothetical protein HQL18_05595, partial [Candidatus Omnitrophica bacterium]|nr:hypothetical protein [Candidatus Omnitrophota bacterium]